MKNRVVLAKDLIVGNRFRMLGDLDFHVVVGNATSSLGGGLRYFVGKEEVVIWYSNDQEVLVEVGCCGMCIEGSDECGEGNYIPIVVGVATEKEVEFKFPSVHLRWLVKTDKEGNMPSRFLQQLWCDGQGGEEWRDVPIVNEDNN